MEIVYSDEMLERYITTATDASPDRPILVDKFLEDAVEVDVDAIYDGDELLVGGILEHIEEAGVHSGDSACVMPPHTLPRELIDTLVGYTEALARELGVRGLINVQYAVRDGVAYVLEANPRASRTVPFCSKVHRRPAREGRDVGEGRPHARRAARARAAAADVRRTSSASPFTAVKEAVLPWGRFPGVDIILGPEMRSTGEVMGIDADFPRAFAKAEDAAGTKLPRSGAIFITLRDRDKPGDHRQRAHAGRARLRDLLDGRARRRCCRRTGITATPVAKIDEGKPDVVDLVTDGKVDLVFNTPAGRDRYRADGYQIREATVRHGVPCITTLTGAIAAVAGHRGDGERAGAREGAAGLPPRLEARRRMTREKHEERAWSGPGRGLRVQAAVRSVPLADARRARGVRARDARTVHRAAHAGRPQPAAAPSVLDPPRRPAAGLGGDRRGRLRHPRARDRAARAARASTRRSRCSAPSDVRSGSRRSRRTACSSAAGSAPRRCCSSPRSCAATATASTTSSADARRSTSCVRSRRSACRSR